jgi:hypothetical protein
MKKKKGKRYWIKEVETFKDNMIKEADKILRKTAKGPPCLKCKHWNPHVCINAKFWLCTIDHYKWDNSFNCFERKTKCKSK